MSGAPSGLVAEAQRIREVYRARDAAAGDRYAAWQPGEEMMRASRRRAAARLLTRAGVFPRPGEKCLEIGCGTLGWLADLIGWGVLTTDLSGIDLDERRLAVARKALPLAELRVGDASLLPWEAGSFRLVILSTVLSSILDPALRLAVAGEAARVLAPGGALLVYDMAVPSPGNRDVVPISRTELRRLFPALSGRACSVTLAPPLARAVAPRSFALAALLESVPLLRTHRLAVLVPDLEPKKMSDAVPFFRPDVGEAEVAAVADAVRSGWLTTGPRTRSFEAAFAEAVGGAHAVAVNSCTAALHLALEALGVVPGCAVLVPTMTFAATAEVVRYLGAVPVLVDCDPVTLNVDLKDAERKLDAVEAGTLARNVPKGTRVVGLVPVHVGGLMLDMDEVNAWAKARGLWVVEDAAHAFPAAYRAADGLRWCGQGSSSVSCFSFYANKTITTGEGGMAVTDDPALADRMRTMSLHGLSHDSWNRFAAGSRAWDYRILAPGFKYNMTDVAAALGLVQLSRAAAMREEREATARFYREALAGIPELELPPDPPDRVHAWHLFPIRLVPRRLALTRDAFLDALKDSGIGCSVHYRPLHLHPYYQDTYGWLPEDLPAATEAFARILSLPLFPGMREDERRRVVGVVRRLCAENARRAA